MVHLFLLTVIFGSEFLDNQFALVFVLPVMCCASVYILSLLKLTTALAMALFIRGNLDPFLQVQAVKDASVLMMS